MADFTHFNEQGNARMVDVTGKNRTARTAEARGKVHVNGTTFRLIRTGGISKGDVLTVAQTAGIMAAKKTSDLIPMCHPLMLTGADILFNMNEADSCVEIRAIVKCSGQTGVEMEALTAVSVAALTIYDMCKAVQKDILISDIRLIRKTGGKSGDLYLEV